MSRIPLTVFGTLLFFTFIRFSLHTVFPTATPALAQSAPWPDLQTRDLGFDFDRPIHITHAGDGSNRLFVVERPGNIRIVQNNALLPTPFLDIQSRVTTRGECGLLSMAFPPDYAAKGYFYVYYSSATNLVGPDEGCDSVIARIHLTGDPNVADAASAEVILQLDQPFNNHNGGQIAFGPDGLLYIGLGDGGNGGDPLNAGQRGDTLLGKIVRLDVENAGANPYAVPATNPFVADSAMLDEIWALGLRNPWRFSFDRDTGDLYIGDVGQGKYEEIDYQPAASAGGENYGWRLMEGLHCYNPSTNCNPGNLTMPVAEYGHDVGFSVTGGVVYRGSTYPQMQGVYFYADYVSGRIWALRRNGSAWENSELLDTALNVSSFGEDEAGNVYLTHMGGRVYELVDGPIATPTPTSTPSVTPSPTATPAGSTTVPTATPGGTSTLPTPNPGNSPGDTLYLPFIERE